MSAAGNYNARIGYEQLLEFDLCSLEPNRTSIIANSFITKMTYLVNANSPGILGHVTTNSCPFREHEEFIWLHSCLEENENYAGFIVSD